MTKDPVEFAVADPDSVVLRSATQDVGLAELRTKALQADIDQMLDFVYGKSNKGENRDNHKPTTVGLSANQVSLSKSIAIVDLAIGHKDFNDVHTLINPKIVWSSKTRVKRAEGCVNLDNIWGEVERPNRVKVEAYDRSGNKISLDLHGWPAALLQHEIDHLNGKLFIDRIDDPTKAHLVKKGEYTRYKKEHGHWQNLIDVSKLVRA